MIKITHRTHRGRWTFQLIYHPGYREFKICLESYSEWNGQPTLTPWSGVGNLRRDVIRLKAELDSVLKQAEKIQATERTAITQRKRRCRTKSHHSVKKPTTFCGDKK